MLLLEGEEEERNNLLNQEEKAHTAGFALLILYECVHVLHKTRRGQPFWATTTTITNKNTPTTTAAATKNGLKLPHTQWLLNTTESGGHNLIETKVFLAKTSFGWVFITGQNVTPKTICSRMEKRRDVVEWREGNLIGNNM